MPSFIQPFVDSSIEAYNSVASSALDKVRRLQEEEEKAVAFSESEQLHKSDVAMDAKVRSNTKYLLNDVGQKLSAQV